MKSNRDGGTLPPEMKQFNTVEEVLVEINRLFGRDVLTDKMRLVACFSDLAPQLAKQRRILRYFAECGGAQRLVAVTEEPTDAQRAAVMQIIKTMKEEMFIEETAARMVCEAFLYAVAGRRLTAVDIPAPAETETSAVFATETPEAPAVLTAEEQFQKGEEYYHGTAAVVKDHRRAFMWYQKAAWRDHAMAQYRLGWMYREGQGTQKDEAAAVEWYKKAADQALAVAQIALGRAYAEGRGVEKDQKAALAWYQKAGDNADAMLCIGACYEQGTGIARDEAQALAWYEKAARAGSHGGVVAMLMLLGQKKCLTEVECQRFMGAIVTTDRELEALLVRSGFYIALEMVRYESTRTSGIRIICLAAQGGKAEAQLYLAEAYAGGECLPRDEKLAAYWYQKAAAQGNEVAKAGLRKLNQKELTEENVDALVKKYALEHKFLTSATPAFGKKLPKAVNAYAYSAIKEKPLLMEDTSILGSAREGFVLTGKTLFYSGGLLVGKSSCPVERIESVSVRGDKTCRVTLKISPVKPGETGAALDLTYAGNREEAERIRAFWQELLGRM